MTSKPIRFGAVLPGGTATEQLDLEGVVIRWRQIGEMLVREGPFMEHAKIQFLDEPFLAHLKIRHSNCNVASPN